MGNAFRKYLAIAGTTRVQNTLAGCLIVFFVIAALKLCFGIDIVR